MKPAADHNYTTNADSEDFDNEYYTTEFDLEHTGEDWEYDNCCCDQVVHELDNWSSRNFDLVLF